MSKLKQCLCGEFPVIVNKIGELTKSVTKVYKCQKCGLEGEMSWLSDDICIESWNHTIELKKKVLKPHYCELPNP